MLNFKDVFSDISSKTAIAVLEECPTPKLMIETDGDRLILIIKENFRKSIEWATKKSLNYRNNPPLTTNF